MKTFSITNETEVSGKPAHIPKLPFEEIKIASLGKNYTLSLIFTSPEKMKKLNLIYRDKNTATDILSFPIDEIEGEIYICLEEAKKEAVKFERTFENFIGFLFIHGCVHLKGHDHGSTMENVEVKLRKQFQI
jgi:probable rRNA maturation factor